MNKVAIGISMVAIIISIYSVTVKSDPTISANVMSTSQIPPENPDTLVFVNARSLEIPKKLTFAGEEVPLHIPDVLERFDRELHINTYWHNNTIFLIKRANRWLPTIEKILIENGVPPDFKYVAVIESGLENVRSPADAVGFWQFVKGTGKEYGLEINREVDERYHVEKATEAAAKYLLKSYEKFGSWTNVAASYNRGMSGFSRAVSHQKVNSYYDLYMNSETSRYLFRVLAIKEILKNPSKYGFKIDENHLYKREPLRFVKVDQSIKDLIGWSLEQGINYKLLKRHNPWLRDDKLTSVRREYEIAIPINENFLNK